MSSPLSDSFSQLSKFYSAKLFILIDKLSNTVSGVANSMAVGLESTFTQYSDTDIELSLKQSKAFKQWHRGMEDLIDDISEQLRDKTIELADAFYLCTKNNEEVKTFSTEIIDETYLRCSGLSPRKTAESLHEIAQILEASPTGAGMTGHGFTEQERTGKNFKTAEGLMKEENSSPLKEDLSRGPEVSGDKSGLRGEHPLEDLKESITSAYRDQPSQENRNKASSPGQEEDEHPAIKNIRITKGVIGAHSRLLLDFQIISTTFVRAKTVNTSTWRERTSL